MIDRSQVRILVRLGGAAAVVMASSVALAQSDNALLIERARVFTGSEVLDSTSVLVENGQIVVVDPDAAHPTARRIDAEGSTLLPGLIDSHVHVFAGSAGLTEEEHRAYATSELAGWMRELLHHGVTTIKSTGDPTDLVLAVREDLRQGRLKGPCLLVSGPVFTAPGGHPAVSICGGEEWCRSHLAAEVASEEAARARVRHLAEQKVDAIKLVYEGGEGRGIRREKLRPEVMRALLDEAHKHDLPVTVHTGDVQSAIEVVEAGAAGVEHGVRHPLTGDRLARLLIDRGASYVPTLGVAALFNASSQVELVVQGGKIVFERNGSSSAKAPEENKQAMAATPDALVDMLSDFSFLPPETYRRRVEQAIREHVFPFDLAPIPRTPKQGKYASITRQDLASYGARLAAFGKKAKDDGEILWGRIQGTEYERATLRWLAEKLESFGIADVRHDTFPSAFPQWRPTACDLEIVSAPGFATGQTYRFEHALTAFASGTTPEGGVLGEIVYVGDGTLAELKGRDLTDKIVLLRARTYPSVLFNSARTAVPRIATGRHGRPLGVVVWWDVPRATQVAGRVGAVGGGDDLAKGIPWTSIGNDAGYYLRKLVDRGTEQTPVIARLDVQGKEEPPADRLSGNVYGILPGRSGAYIIVMTHVDGYFYGLHDNGAAVAVNLALAKYYASQPEAEREHGIVFLFEGDHEVPGVGGTIPFIERNKRLVSESLLLVLRLEHTGVTQPIQLGELYEATNTARPSTLLITNRSPVLKGIFRSAITRYAIPTANFVFIDPAADEAAFHPPYNELGAISAGFSTTGPLYHTPMDVERDLVDFEQLERMARAHAFVIDALGAYTKEDLERGGAAPPAESVYRSDFFKLFMGNF